MRRQYLKSNKKQTEATSIRAQITCPGPQTANRFLRAMKALDHSNIANVRAAIGNQDGRCFIMQNLVIFTL